MHDFIQVGSRVFLPNLPSVCALLYRIKHVVEITPVTFPKGMPDDFHPDTHGFRLTPTGEFIVEVVFVYLAFKDFDFLPIMTIECRAHQLKV